jgi:glucose-1-phosphate thymidylyltransferase
MQAASHFKKGIILAGGSGSRLDPLTRAASKQLLPVYDKPMVYYPLSLLMLAGIRQILIVTTPHDLGSFKRLFGDGTQLGLAIEYAPQPRPEGLAQAFVIGRDFIGNDACALVLGDNLLHGPNLRHALQPALQRRPGATIFGYQVPDPQRYGVVEFDDRGQVLSLEEKPLRPRSSFAVPGLYFYDNSVVDVAARLKPSPRGEFEITDLNRSYLQQGRLHVELLSADLTWMDAGTTESLFRAAEFVRDTQYRFGHQIGCIEETALQMGFITAQQLTHLAHSMRNDYGAYLLELVRANGVPPVLHTNGRAAA